MRQPVGELVGAGAAPRGRAERLGELDEVRMLPKSTPKWRPNFLSCFHTIDPYWPFSNHRIAMAFAIAGLFAEGETIVQDVDCVNTSYPGFHTQLEQVIRDSGSPGTPTIGNFVWIE